MGLRKFGWVVICALALQVCLAAPALAYEWPDLLQTGDKSRAVKALQVRIAGWYPDAEQNLFEIDGVFDADPRTSPGARLLTGLTAVVSVAGLVALAEQGRHAASDHLEDAGLDPKATYDSLDDWFAALDAVNFGVPRRGFSRCPRSVSAGCS